LVELCDYVAKSGAQIRTKGHAGCPHVGDQACAREHARRTARSRRDRYLGHWRRSCLDCSGETSEIPYFACRHRWPVRRHRVVIGETTSSSFADTGLTPQSTYHWHVAVIANNVAGPVSTDVSAATRATPAPRRTPVAARSPDRAARDRVPRLADCFSCLLNKPLPTDLCGKISEQPALIGNPATPHRLGPADMIK
jgi:hypothetical protein